MDLVLRPVYRSCASDRPPCPPSAQPPDAASWCPVAPTPASWVCNPALQGPQRPDWPHAAAPGDACALAAVLQQQTPLCVFAAPLAGRLAAHGRFRVVAGWCVIISCNNSVTSECVTIIQADACQQQQPRPYVWEARQCCCCPFINSSRAASNTSAYASSSPPSSRVQVCSEQHPAAPAQHIRPRPAAHQAAVPFWRSTRVSAARRPAGAAAACRPTAASGSTTTTVAAAGQLQPRSACRCSSASSSGR